MSEERQPVVYILAGPNGAGKSTFSKLFLALTRVDDRVRVGGHHVPEEVVRRRFKRGLNNFFRLYLPLLDSWLIFDNSGKGPKMVAFGFSDMHVAFEPEIFAAIEGEGRAS